jgi:hypothetical protein
LRGSEQREEEMTYPARLAAVLVAAIGATAAPRLAEAVIVEAGAIETNGTLMTADRFYFEVQVGGAIEISIVDLTNPVKIARPSLNIYQDDGTLDAANLLFSAAAAAAGLAAVLNTAIGAGSYVALVSEFALAAGVAGPLNPGALNAIAYDYEIGFSGIAATDTQVTCIAHGNLGGGFTTTERVSGACASLVEVPEPQMLAPFALAMGMLFGSGALLSRRFTAYCSTSSA